MIKAVASVIILLLLAVGAYFTFQAGVDAERAEQAANREAAREKDSKKVEKVNKFKEKQKVVIREKIKYIKTAPDPTGCADIPLVDMGFGL